MKWTITKKRRITSNLARERKKKEKKKEIERSSTLINMLVFQTLTKFGGSTQTLYQTSNFVQESDNNINSKTKFAIAMYRNRRYFWVHKDIQFFNIFQCHDWCWFRVFLRSAGATYKLENSSVRHEFYIRTHTDGGRDRESLWHWVKTIFKFLITSCKTFFWPPPFVFVAVFLFVSHLCSQPITQYSVFRLR